RGIDNTPSDETVKNLIVLCEQILEPARVVIGPLHISSGYRCPELNEAIGGSKTSAHCLGYAADVTPLSSSKLSFARWVKDNCRFDQIILEYGTKEQPAWVHVSCDPRSRGQVLRILKGTGYLPVDLNSL